jgi:putative membrane protein
VSFGHWELQPLQLAPKMLLGLLYLRRAQGLARRGRRVSGLRRLSFFGGVTFLLLALVSPLDYLGENRLLYAHMIQHLMLGDIAPLLVVLGTTGAMLRPVLAVKWLRPLRALSHPLAALPLWVVDLYVWHSRVLYQAALHNDAIHALEHFCFFSCGALMWAAVIEPLPGPEWFGNGYKALYTLVVRSAGAVLANLFIWSGHPLYPYYVPLESRAGVSPLTDQRIAGAIMFIEGSVVTMLAFAWLFIRFSREMEIRQRLLERNLDPDIAARSARYGRAARVRDVS